MNKDFLNHLSTTIDDIRSKGLYKAERVIATPQGAKINANHKNVINLCANNYLGLANNPELVKTAHDALDKWGYGTASVRFICGTFDIHKQLEAAISKFFQTEDTILYSSCFDANGGLFETILSPEDAIISDELNHASIIDGIRLCKAKRYRYKNCNMADLEAQILKAKADGARFIGIMTDGVFSMDGYIAPLDKIADLSEKYGCILMVDDSHAAGVIGKTGRGSIEHCGVMGRVDVITGTLGKAFGGGTGGYTTGKKEVIEMLRQRSRPNLFSNSIPPVIAAVGLKVFEMLTASSALVEKLASNTRYFKKEVSQLGFDILEGEHPITPLMFYDAKVAAKYAEKLMDHGVYVTAFSYPVVPEGRARIRTQVSAATDEGVLNEVLDALKKVKAELGYTSQK